MAKTTVRKTYTNFASADVVIPAGVKRLRVMTFFTRRAVEVQGTQGKWLQPDNTIVTLGGAALLSGNNTILSSPTVISQIEFRTLQLGTYPSNQFFAALDRNGVAYVWGSNANGQLGNNTVVNSGLAIVGRESAQGFFPFREIHAMGIYTLARDFKGEIWTWGRIGDGSGPGGTNSKSSPTMIVRPAGVSSWKQVVPGVAFDGFVAQGDDNWWYAVGSRTGWGVGTTGSTTCSTPTQILGSSAFEYCVSCDNNQIIWKAYNGDFYFTADTTFAGNPVKSSPLLISPTGAVLPIVNVFVNSMQFTLGGFHCKDSNGQIYTYGTNAAGQLGDNSITDRSTWTAVVGLPNNVKMIYRGGQSGSNQAMYALTENGLVYAVGWNAQGQLGLGDVTNRSTWTLVTTNLSGKVVSEVFTGSGANHVVWALINDGTAYGWGFNNGTLGINSFAAVSSPTLMVGGKTWVTMLGGFRQPNPDFVGASSHSQFTLMTTNQVFWVDVNGTLYSIGFNTNGELSVGDVTPRSSPTMVVRPYYKAASEVFERETWIDVEPGQTYTLNMQKLLATFGDTFIGRFVDKAIVEY